MRLNACLEGTQRKREGKFAGKSWREKERERKKLCLLMGSAHPQQPKRGLCLGHERIEKERNRKKSCCFVCAFSLTRRKREREKDLKKQITDRKEEGEKRQTERKRRKRD